jgi:4-amino-4-deoxy-L-arabinose transferase-like glycosyltransferase
LAKRKAQVQEMRDAKQNRAAVSAPGEERERRLRWGSLAAAAVLLCFWVGMLLLNPSLFPEGGWEGNAPWRDHVPRAIRLVGDTPRYILGAENLLAGRPLENKQGSYAGYVAVVAACLGCGVGLQGVVAVQVLVALLSLPCIYGLGRRLGGALTGALAVLLHAGNPEVAAWHTIIQTDSLYISALVCFVWLYVEARERGWAWRLAVVPAGIALVLIRPNGWIVPPVLCMHAILTAGRWSWRRRLAGLAALAVVLLSGAFGVSSLRRGIEAESPVQMLYKGEVLWGHAPWRLRMPPAPGAADDWGSGLGYVCRHPLACTKLALARVTVLFGRVRPSYSFRHNLFLLCAYPPLYLLALWGIWRRWRRWEVGLLLAVIGGHVLTVALTFDHVDGRFFLYFLPELVVLSAAGAAAIVGGMLRFWPAADGYQAG